MEVFHLLFCKGCFAIFEENYDGMTEYISGKIAELTPTHVVVDNNGIGYSLEISLQTYAALENRSEAVVYVQQQVNAREGTAVDYGFADKQEREVFRMITGVSGIGAASARMMLSSMSSQEIREAILTGDVNRLKSVKGVGVKSAQRLVLELKDKMAKGEGTDVSAILLASDVNAAAEEASAALQMLGFSKPNISKAVQAILRKNPSSGVEDIIRTALQML